MKRSRKNLLRLAVLVLLSVIVAGCVIAPPGRPEYFNDPDRAYAPYSPYPAPVFVPASVFLRFGEGHYGHYGHHDHFHRH